MHLSAGTRLGPYEVLCLLGEGGMGEVYRARDSKLGRDVAMKVLPASLADDPERMARFEREAQVLASLNHPHVAAIYGLEESGGVRALVMELVEGKPLQGPLPLREAITCAAQILEALDAAHGKGITHRDLKPANILVSKQGIKLLDFGLAKQNGPLEEAEATLTAALTGKGQIVGTLQYMSPEQLHGKEADARSDLFSFGCVLYEMLSGKRAFEGQSAASVIAAILEREPAPLDVTPPLERVVRRCLAKDPDQRFQTARDLAATLAWAMEQPPQIVAAKPSPRWGILAAGAAAILLLAGLAGWAVSQWRRPPADERVLRLQINPPEGGRFILDPLRGGIALSPDGRTAAFVASGAGKRGLWLRPLDGTEARLLVSADEITHPFWSPDNKSIAYFAGSKLQRVDVAGGAPFTLCAFEGFSLGGTWSSDGRIVFSFLGSGLMQVSAQGGTAVPLTTLDLSHEERGHSQPQVIGGGRVIFTIRAGQPRHDGIYAISLANPSQRVLVMRSETNAIYARGSGREYLLWARGSTLLGQEVDTTSLRLLGEPHPVADPVSQSSVVGWIDVAASATGQILHGSTNRVGQFTWFDRTGKRLSTVGESGQYSTFRLSPDGRRLLAARDSGARSHLWLIDVERGVSSRFTSGDGSYYYPVWSADGRTVLYSTARVPRGLFAKDAAGGGGEQRLTQTSYLHSATDWSRDGRFILFAESASGTQRDIWIMPMTGDMPSAVDKPTPYLRSPAYEHFARFSPEMNPGWIAYESDESGRLEVYIDTFPEKRRKTRISVNGGSYPEWGPGGRELFYVSPDSKMMTVSLKLGTDLVELSGPQELFSMPALDTGYSPFNVSPDGQRFLVLGTPEREGVQPLTLIVNWPALLKTKSGTQ